METTRSGSHPDLLQGFLQVDDDLAAIGEGQGDHAAAALVVDVGISGIVDAVASLLNHSQGLFGQVQILKVRKGVGHYNPYMFFMPRIIAVAPILLGLTGLSACGQKGPLFLTPQSVPYQLLPGGPMVVPFAESVVAPIALVSTAGTSVMPASSSSAAK